MTTDFWRSGVVSLAFGIVQSSSSPNISSMQQTFWKPVFLPDRSSRDSKYWVILKFLNFWRPLESIKVAIFQSKTLAVSRLDTFGTMSWSKSKNYSSGTIGIRHDLAPSKNLLRVRVYSFTRSLTVGLRDSISTNVKCALLQLVTHFPQITYVPVMGPYPAKISPCLLLIISSSTVWPRKSGLASTFLLAIYLSGLISGPEMVWENPSSRSFTSSPGPHVNIVFDPNTKRGPSMQGYKSAQPRLSR